MKLFGLIFSLFFVFVFTALLIVPFALDWNSYKPQIKGQLEKRSGYQVILDGDVHVSLFPSPKAYIRDVVVRSPVKSEFENLATLGQLDLNIAFMPLLTGALKIDSIRLVDPRIFLERGGDGSANWETPELIAFMAEEDDASGGQGKTGKGADIFIEELMVQGGEFVFLDGSSGHEYALQGIDVSLRAETLSGPFYGRGDMQWEGDVVGFEFRTARFEKSGKPVPVNGSVSVGAGGVDVSYSGVLVTGETPELQGETSVTFKNVKGFLGAHGVDAAFMRDHSLSLKGLVTASPESVVADSLALNWAGARFSGTVKGDLKEAPLFDVSLRAQDPLDMDKVLSGSASGAGMGVQRSASDKSGGGFLPGHIALPSLHMRFGLEAPKIVYRQEVYDNVRVDVSLKDEQADIQFKSDNIPGKGALALSGTVFEKGPVAHVTLQAESSNLPYSLQSMVPGLFMEQFENYKNGSIRFGGKIAPDRIMFDDVALRLDDSRLQASGSYKAIAGQRPFLQVDLRSERLNLDKFTVKDVAVKSGGVQEAQNSSSVREALAKFALPFDLDFQVQLQDLVLQGHSYEGVAAKGNLRENNVGVEALSVKNFSGAAIQGKGRIGNIAELDDIDVTVSAQSADIQALAKVLQVDASSLPGNMGMTDISVNAKGDERNMDVLANIQAMNGKVIAKGRIHEPLGNMSTESLSLQVQHRNANEALQIFSPGSSSFPSLNEPVDVYTTVKIQDKIYSLQDIQAKIADTSIQGKGALDVSGDKPFFSGDLAFSDLVLTPEGASEASVVKASGHGADVRWSREALDLGWMHQMDFDVALSGQSLRYKKWDLRDPSLKAALRDGRFSLEKFDAKAFSGAVYMSGMLEAPADKRQPLNLSGDAKVRDVSLEPLVLALSGGRILKGSGKVSMDTSVKSSGVSPAALIYDLSGSGTVAGEKIVLEGFDLVRFGRALSEETKLGDSVLGLWKGTIKGGQTTFDTLDGGYDIREGVVHVTRLELDGPEAGLKTTGNVDLTKWQISTDHTVHLKDYADIPDFTVQIRGPLDNPGQTFGQGVLDDYLKRKLQRKLDKLAKDKLGGALSDTIGKILGGAAPAADDNAGSVQGEGDARQGVQQPMKPEEAFEGLLKGLLSQ